MATARKRISELTALTSASLDTVIVGVDNGTTYKIELDVLADAVTSRVNILDRDRLQSLESTTSSFETKGRNVISSSAQITTLGFTSSSANLTSLNSFTSSQSATNTALTNGINARLTTSSFESFSSSVHSEILAATNEQDLTPYVTELVYGVLSQSVDSRIDNLELNSGSYLTSLNGAISSSSQLTSSYDVRYVLSGSITQTTWDNISGKPSGLVSQSTDLSLLNTFTESIDNRVDALESFSSSLNSTFATDLEVSIVSSSVAATIGVISQNTGLVSTSSFNSYTASQSTSSLVNRLNAIENVSGSWITESETGSFLTNLNGAISSSSQLTSSYDTRYILSGSVQPLPSNLISSSAQITTLGFISSSDSITSLNSYTSSLKGAIELTGSTVSFLGNIVVYGTQSVITSTNVELSDNILYLSPTASTDNDLGIVGHYNDGTYRHAGIFMDASDGHSWKVFNGLQTETTATVDTSGTGFALADFKAGVFTGTSFNGIINATNGVVSGSSQLTSSFDTRYTLSGSISATPVGTISGSSQITSLGFVSGSYETTGRGIISSSANLVTTSSFNSYTASISTASLVSSITNLNNATSSYLTSLNGVISSSSQLTSSFDTRYVASASVTVTGTTTTNLIKYTRSTQQTGLSNGSVVICNVLENSLGNLISANTSTGQITLTAGKTYRLIGMVPNFTTSGNPWPQFCWYNETTAAYIGNSAMSYPPSSNAAYGAFGGPAEAVITANTTTIVSFRLQQGASGLTGIGGSGDFATAGSYPWIDIEEIGSTFALNALDTMQLSGSLVTTGSMTSIGGITGSIAATNGIVSGSSQLTSSYDTRYTLSGSVQPLPTGLISGSSQLTSSLDTRYAASGSVGGAAPAGTVSGSSQLTSSLDLRYLVTGSVTSSILQLNTFTASNANTSLNTFTSSLNIWSSSLATTGSNSFNGNQTVTGSLTVSSVAVISSSFTANSSSLTLNSGSNFYLQNNGIAQITGSLNVSGSTTFTGSISISSGSITMPNRPAFRVYGAGGGTAATTVLSGSMTIVDYNQGGWDNTTGTFTAPIAGLYQVNIVARCSGNSNPSAQVIVYKNNTGGASGTTQIMLEWAANTTANHMGGSTITKLAVGDTLKAVVALGSISFDGNDNFSVAYIG